MPYRHLKNEYIKDPLGYATMAAYFVLQYYTIPTTAEYIEGGLEPFISRKEVEDLLYVLKHQPANLKTTLEKKHFLVLMCCLELMNKILLLWPLRSLFWDSSLSHLKPDDYFRKQEEPLYWLLYANRLVLNSVRWKLFLMPSYYKLSKPMRKLIKEKGD